MTLHTRETLTEIRQQGEIALGMAQLSVSGLSEDWWLKHLGDIHWQMIATAMGQDDPVFYDAEGRLIYAAFCATHFEQPYPQGAVLGGRLNVCSSLWQAGRSRLQSIHEVHAGDRLVARVRLVTTFVTHGQAGVNKSVLRVPPAIIPVLPKAPDGFADQAASRARMLRTAHRAGRLEAEPLQIHQPQADLDFNAVGLLYFPSFTRMSSQAEAARPRQLAPLRSRMMLYFGNVEMGEAVSSGMLGENEQKQKSEIGLFGAAGDLLAVCEVQRHA